MKRQKNYIDACPRSTVSFDSHQEIRKILNSAKSGNEVEQKQNSDYEAYKKGVENAVKRASAKIDINKIAAVVTEAFMHH